ncbi:MAG: hypothetical protein KKB88_02565, partial [Nanoarchaeota archaeon]|nr:hypothetical protein [Nanoarchaeota archaeon]
MKKEDIQKKLRIIKDPLDKIDYLNKVSGKEGLGSKETRKALRDTINYYSWKLQGDHLLNEYDNSKKEGVVVNSSALPVWYSDEINPLDKAIIAYQNAGEGEGVKKAVKRQIDYFKNILAKSNGLGFTDKKDIDEIRGRLDSENIKKYGLTTEAKLAKKKIALGILGGIKRHLDMVRKQERQRRRNPLLSDLSSGVSSKEVTLIPDIQYVSDQYNNALKFAESAGLKDLSKNILRDSKSFE